MRRLFRVVAAATLLSCSVPGALVGVDEATIVTIDTRLPFTADLPLSAIEAQSAELSYAVTVPVPVDVIAALRARGREDDAKLIEENRGKLLAVELVAVEYEVPAPNRMPVDLKDARLFVTPIDHFRLDAAAREVGRIKPILAGQAVPSTELIYASTGKADAALQIQSLMFTLLLDASFVVPRAVAIPAKAIRARLRLHVRARIDLAG